MNAEMNPPWQSLLTNGRSFQKPFSKEQIHFHSVIPNMISSGYLKLTTVVRSGIASKHLERLKLLFGLAFHEDAFPGSA